MMYRFFGKRERLIGILQAYLCVAVLKQEIELAEHLGKIASIDLVDDEEVLGVSCIPSISRGVQQRAIPQLETGLPVYERRTEALNEVLVGVGRMELLHPCSVLFKVETE